MPAGTTAFGEADVIAVMRQPFFLKLELFAAISAHLFGPDTSLARHTDTTKCTPLIVTNFSYFDLISGKPVILVLPSETKLFQATKSQINKTVQTFQTLLILIVQ